MRVLVVIPCLNEAHHLGGLVVDLIGSKVQAMHIVIADGGSTDGTLELAQNLAARFPNVSLLINPKRVQSAGMNLAVSEFGKHAEFVIRVDAHAEYPSDYCQVLVEEAERTGASSVVVAMKTIGIGWFQRAVAEAQNSRLGNGGAAHRLMSTDGMWTDHGHHALMRIDAFTRAGGYDESFSHNEDAELDIRLRQLGFKIWLTGRTSIKYYPRSSAGPLFHQYVNWGTGRAKTMIKHRTPLRVRQLVPVAILPLSLIALGAPILHAAAIPLMTWATVCLGYGLCLAVKEKSISTLAAGPAAMIMHMGYSLGFWRTVLRTLRSRVFGAKKP
ncbi:MAG: glycosyltransferase family 2 protein [Steroidobacteraceae bacterium]